MTKMIVRQYEEPDLEQLLNVWGSSTRFAHPFLSEPFLIKERENIPNIYLPMADTWIVEEEGELRGFLALIGNEVGAIFVDPAFHGKGLGKALMDKASSLHRILELEVFAANSLGRSFYDRYGFTLMHAYMHEETGNEVLRIVYTRPE